MSAPAAGRRGRLLGSATRACRRRPGAEPPAGPRLEPGGSALRRSPAGALGEARGEPGGRPRFRGRGASSDARRAPTSRAGEAAAAAPAPAPRSRRRPPRPLVRRTRRPRLPGLGVRRATPACAERELRGPREPGTSAAEAEAETRRGGPSATPWPRLKSSLRPGRGAATAAAPSQARERALWKHEPFARPRAPSLSGSRGRAAVLTSNLAGAGCAQSPRALSASLPFQPRPRTPLSKASSDLSPRAGNPDTLRGR